MDRSETGQFGERAAAAFLESHGCEIVARNYRWSRAEVDIIAREGKTLHFVEVKTRHWDDVDLAKEAVSRRQQGRIMGAAGRYMEDVGYEGDFQFGIVVVILDAGGGVRIEWTPDAFGWEN